MHETVEWNMICQTSSGDIWLNHRQSLLDIRSRGSTAKNVKARTSGKQKQLKNWDPVTKVIKKSPCEPHYKITYSLSKYRTHGT